ncbi:MAG: deacetylase [Candidatus Sumerlaeia bacterium]|nr:deacetylase [Candidatus Sumerlaeia bacterium]
MTASEYPARPAFLITIDTEGDNLWARPREITTRNAAFLPRFQALCDRFAFRPTYLTNFEMAQSPVFQAFARDALARGTAEVGMHLHSWNSPPIKPLTADDFTFHPYLFEFPGEVMREKVHVMTDLLEQTFQRPVVSHRAGRWGLDARYARILAQRGYRVDCSVTPHVSWKHDGGDPSQHGGQDFRGFPEEPYFLDLDDISRAGVSGLLEVPMTILPSESGLVRRIHRVVHGVRTLRRVAKRLAPAAHWLQPNGRNGASLRRIVERVVAEGRLHLQFTTHSSELMPGGGPYFRTERDIDRLYGEDLEPLFEQIAQHFTGATLAGFRERFDQ